jgi:Leucine-rich repeat (LRR) protein
VIISVISQTFAAEKKCDWNDLNQEQYRYNYKKFTINGCNSPTIDSIFLGQGSEKNEILQELIIQTSLTVIGKEQFVQATRLEILDLSSNKIHSVNENAFNGLHTVKTIDLQDNKIESLPLNIVADQPSLWHLRLDGNNLTSFDFSIVKQNPKLIELNIARNAITRVRTSEQYSSNLQIISMQRNLLTSLPMENLPELPVLVALYIDFNNLTDFGFEKVKKKFPKLGRFHFGSNQFECGFLMDMVSGMILHNPWLGIDDNFINNLKDFEAFQKLSKCTTCGCFSYRNKKKLDELEAIIEKYVEKNNRYVILGYVSAIGVAIVIFVMITIGCLYFFYFKQTANPQSMVENSCKHHHQPNDENENNFYEEIPPKNQTEEFYESMM